MSAGYRAQRGSVQIIIIVSAVVALIAALGYVYWQSSSDGGVVINEQSNDAKKDTGESSRSAIPDGWSVRGISYAAPKATDVTYSSYGIDEMIHVGYGAPVYVKYNATDGWRTYQTDVDGLTAREDNSVVALDALAEDIYLAHYYETGDGPTGESRVLIVTDTAVHQFAFTQQLQSEELMNQFVQTVKFDL